MFKYIIATVSMLLTSIVVAEDSISENGYNIHYNSFPTTFLSRDVAKNYQIKRSKNRGMVNISVLKQQNNELPTAVEAEIIFMVKNLYGQDKKFELRKITESDEAIYYIGTYPVTNGETINFNVYVTPKGSTHQTHIKFSREFFTD